ncbi:MAG: hypothetical protein Alpg2KO_21490 [Alphaproteobacteria bacterium]
MSRYKRFSLHRGASLLSYGLVVGLIAVVALGAVTSIGSNVDSLFTTVSGEMEDVVDDGGTVAQAQPSASAAVSPSPSPSPSAQVFMVNGNFGVYPFVEDPNRPAVHNETSMNAVCTAAGFSGVVTTCGTPGDDPDGFGCSNFPTYRTNLSTATGENDFSMVGRRNAGHGASPAECGVTQLAGSQAAWCTCNSYRTSTNENCSSNTGWTERLNQSIPVYVICAP